MAASTRTSTRISLVPPTCRNTDVSSTRSRFTCVDGLISPISSRKIVPPWATSNRPGLALSAPVNAPRSCPNSSLCSRLSCSAAQSTTTNGLDLRGLRAWSSLATRSLPAAGFAHDQHRGIAGPHQFHQVQHAAELGALAHERSRLVRRRQRRAPAGSRAAAASAARAPAACGSGSRPAGTAWSRSRTRPRGWIRWRVSMEPWPVSMITSTDGLRARMAFKVSRPSIPGSRRSSSTTSGSCVSSLRDRLLAGSGGRHLVPQAPQFARHHVAKGRVVIHQQNRSRRLHAAPARGSTISNVEPWPGVALHPNISAPPAHEVQREEQAQSRAALRAR